MHSTDLSRDLSVDDAITMENSPTSLFDAVKFDMDQIQLSLEQIEQNEKEVVMMSKKAELDIDDVLDSLLSRIVKLISKKKREMKAQVTYSSFNWFFFGWLMLEQ